MRTQGTGAGRAAERRSTGFDAPDAERAASAPPYARTRGVRTSMRVPRTFVFVDLSGFTNYTAAYGDDAAACLLSRLPQPSPARSPPTVACASPSGSATAA